MSCRARASTAITRAYNLKDHSEIIHINIEKADRIQEQLVSKVVELAATPATAEGEAVPIHLEVPADAAVELWDSGQPVTRMPATR